MHSKETFDQNNLKRFSNNSVGNYFFRKGLYAIIKNNWILAAMMIVEGLKTKSCDCIVECYLEVNSIDNVVFQQDLGIGQVQFIDMSQVFADENAVAHGHLESFLFCKSFTYSFSDDQYMLQKGLEAGQQFLNNYVPINPTKRGYDLTDLNAHQCFGFYIEGKLLMKLSKYNEALTSIEKAKIILDCSLLDMMVGKINEQYLSKDGIQNLYQAFLKDESSDCVVELLSLHAVPKGLKLEEDERVIQILQANNAERDVKHYKLFIRLFNDGVKPMAGQWYLSLVHKYKEENSKLILCSISEHVKKQVANILSNRQKALAQERYVEQDIEMDEEDRHNRSNERYGHDDWSDEDIDDIFEGDPDNAWNVD